MNQNQAFEFAKASALCAFDQIAAYEDSYSSYRENLIDTMNDEGEDLNAWVISHALEIFDRECRRLGLI